MVFRKSVLKYLITFPLLSSSLQLKAQLTVLEDKGGESILSYFVGQKVDYVAIDINKELEKQKQLALSVKVEDLYPITTNMTPAKRSNIKFDSKIRLTRPIAVIGIDQLSLEWLLRRKEHLVKLNALVYVVQAQSFDEIKHLASLFSGLTFVPVQASSLDDVIQQDKYPFLINEEGVWQ